MVPKSRLFPASFPAVLAIALFMSTSLASAEVVTLVCQDESTGPYARGGSFTLRVDYDRKIVDMPDSAELSNPVGTAFNSAAATITEGAVEWSTRTDYGFFKGSLNRLSGQGHVSYSEERTLHKNIAGPCRRATQKF